MLGLGLRRGPASNHPHPRLCWTREARPGLCFCRAHCPNRGSLSLPAAARCLTPQPAPSGPPSLGRDGRLRGLSSPASHDLISPRSSQSLPDRSQALRSPGSRPIPPTVATRDSRLAQLAHPRASELPWAPTCFLPHTGSHPNLRPQLRGCRATRSGETQLRGPGCFPTILPHKPSRWRVGAACGIPGCGMEGASSWGRLWGRPGMGSWPLLMRRAILSPSLPCPSCSDLFACLGRRPVRGCLCSGHRGAYRPGRCVGVRGLH